MDTQCQVELFGGLRVRQGERLIGRFSTQKTAALLAYLAYHGSQLHPREALIEMLWPETLSAAGRQSLSQALSSLRHQLEPPGVPTGTILTADRVSIGLTPQAVTTDVAGFEAALAAAARARGRAERAQHLASAVDLYRGPLLPGHYEEWVLTEQVRLEDLFLEACQRLASCWEEDGRYEDAVRVTRQALSVDPTREPVHRDLMRLYMAAGRPEQALRQYRELTRILEQELEDTPSDESRALARRIERMALITTGKTARALNTPATGATPSALTPSALPTGMVTFLLTDIERSTEEWERGGLPYTDALTSHHRLLRETFHRHGGHEAREAGDGFVVAFARLTDALVGAIAGQKALAGHPWPEGTQPIWVRMALHTGEVERVNGEYRGLVLHRAARLLAAAHGGQILCSEAATGLVRRDLPPGVRLSDLGVYRLRDSEAPERLYQVDHADLAHQDFPPPRAEASHNNHLPPSLTRFFGREKEIAQIQALLRESGTRLVTLTGPGGTGKTRLALEAAAGLAFARAGAVWFVALADLTDPGTIAVAIWDALRLPAGNREPSEQRGPLDQAIEALREAAFPLLILDNMEHLIPDGLSIVSALLARVPALTLLATSRQRLGLAGEREIGIPPLQTPNGRDAPEGLTAERLSVYESVQLFVDRAQAVRPDFQVTTQNAASLAELCERLEGLPLAIELAASRMQVLTPLQLLTQLPRRLDLLVGSPRRRGPARHRTLRAAIDWSYRLLSPELQVFFTRLCVFRGGWTAEAAEAVCEEPLALDRLAELQECSLILAEEHSDGMRFGMLETLREFAEEHLEEEHLEEEHLEEEHLKKEPLKEAGEEATRRRHAAFFLAMAGEMVPRIWGTESGAWLGRLEAENANLRAALEWCLGPGGDPQTGLRLAMTLVEFWDKRGTVTEARQWLARALEGSPSGPASERSEAIMKAAQLAGMQADFEAERTLLEQALTLRRDLGDMQAVAYTLTSLGHNACSRADYEEARRFYNHALELGREGSNQSVIVRALISLGLLEAGKPQRDHEAARLLYQDSLTLARDMGDEEAISEVLEYLTVLAFNEGRYDECRTCLEEQLVQERARESTYHVARLLRGLGDVARCQGDFTAAHRFLEESRANYRALNDPIGVMGTLNSQGLVAALAGDFGMAIALYEELLSIAAERGDRSWMAFALDHMGGFARDSGDGGAARYYFERSLALRQTIGPGEAVAKALINLGGLAVAEGRTAEGIPLLTEAIGISREVNTSHTALALVWLGRAERDKGDYAKAESHLEESLSLRQEMGDVGEIASSLAELGGLFLAMGDRVKAADYYGRSLEIWREHQDNGSKKRGTLASLVGEVRVACTCGETLRAARLAGAVSGLSERLLPKEQGDLDHLLLAVREALGELAFGTAFAEGQAMTPNQAIDYALTDFPEAGGRASRDRSPIA